MSEMSELRLQRDDSVNEVQDDAQTSANSVLAEASINTTADSAQTRPSCTSGVPGVFNRVDDREPHLDSSGLTSAFNGHPGLTADQPGNSGHPRRGRPARVGLIAGSRRPVRKYRKYNQGVAHASSHLDRKLLLEPIPGPAAVQAQGSIADKAVTDSQSQRPPVSVKFWANASDQLSTTSRRRELQLWPGSCSCQARLGLDEDIACSCWIKSSQRVIDMTDELSFNPFSSSGTTSTLQFKDQSQTDVPHRSPYTTKRLSGASPDFAPTLRVSSSADRVIMGDRNITYQDMTVRRVPVPVNRETQRARGDRSHTTALNQDRSFPSAGQGIRKVHESRIARPAGEVQKLRAAGVEAQSSSSKEHPKPNPRTVKAVSTGSRNAPLSAGEDPFSDAQPYVEGSPPQMEHAHPESSQSQQHHLSQTATGIEGDTSNSSDFERALNTARTLATPVRRGVPPSISRVHIGTPVAVNVVTARAHGAGHQQAEETASEFDSHSDQDIAVTQPVSFPPRSSSRTTALEFLNQSSPPVPPAPSESRDLSSDSLLPQNHIGSGAGRDHRRSSLPRPSRKSRVLSGVRGLFHKGRKVNVAENGSPLTPVPQARPVHRPTVASENRRTANPRAVVTAPAAIRAPTTPTAVPEPAQVQPGLGTTADIDQAATLVRQVLQTARQSPPGPEKTRLLAVGRVMFAAFTMACDAEVTREAANQMIRRAEISYAQSMQSIVEMADYLRNAVQN